MAVLKSHAKTIAAVLLLGCVANLFGRGYYDASYRSVIEERSIASGQWVCFYTVPGGWAWFGLNLAVAGYGMVAWRYFGGWMTATQVLMLCVLGPLQIDRIENQTELDRWSALGYGTDAAYHPVESQRFALWGGLLAGVIASVGLAALNRGVARERWTSRHLFMAMGAAACLLGSLRIYDWQRREENRTFFVELGAWPEGWQVTDEDRRMHEEWVRKHEEE